MLYSGLMDINPITNPTPVRAFAFETRILNIFLFYLFYLFYINFLLPLPTSHLVTSPTTITFTSSILTPAAYQREVSALLRSPNSTTLNTLRLTGVICKLASYAYERGAWDLQLSRNVAESWQKVALLLYSCSLRAKNE